MAARKKAVRKAANRRRRPSGRRASHAASNPHIANACAMLDFIAAERLVDPTRIGLSESMDELLGCIEWELVDLDAIKSALVLILTNAPASEAEGVSKAADEQRATLENSLKEQAADEAEEKRLAELTDTERAEREADRRGPGTMGSGAARRSRRTPRAWLAGAVPIAARWDALSNPR
jgi:hypothetical protein